VTSTALVPTHPGLWHDAHHRYFYGERGPLPSVTTIIKSLDRSGPLIGWAKRATAECAVRNLDALRTMVETGGKQPAIDWLKSIPDYQRDEAAQMGSLVHRVADQIGRGIEPTDIPAGVDIRPYVTAYQRFLAHTRARILWSEAQVANLTVGYGGTLDVGAELFGDGHATLLDIKTGGVYAETALQLTGYDNAEFTATEDDPTQVPLPEFKQFGVLNLTADGQWTLIPYEVGPEDWEAFLACLRLHRWTKDRAPWTKGTPYQEVGAYERVG